MSYKSELQSNNADLQSILNTVNKLPDVDSGSAEPVIRELTVTKNGTYTAPSGVDGYSPVVVDVPEPTTETWIFTMEDGSTVTKEVAVDV